MPTHVRLAPTRTRRTRRQRVKRLILAAGLDVQRRVWDALDRAGFQPATVERHWFGVYDLAMWRGRFPLAATPEEVAEQIAVILREVGILAEPDSMCVEVEGGFIRVAFVSEEGWEGRFELVGLLGDSLTLETIEKPGYLLSPQARKGFNYGRTPIPFRADSLQPVVFRLWKRQGSASLLGGQELWTLA